MDQVLYEATRDPRHADARRIGYFTRTNSPAVRTFETEVSRAVAARRAAGETGRQKGQGEAALAEFLARLDEVLDHPYDRALLLFEDSDIRTGVFLTAANVDLVSTRGTASAAGAARPDPVGRGSLAGDRGGGKGAFGG